MYVGEYKNEEKTGKGKIYKTEYLEYIEKPDRLIFEGEFVNGKRHGKGKEYSII